MKVLEVERKWNGGQENEDGIVVRLTTEDVHTISRCLTSSSLKIDGRDSMAFQFQSLFSLLTDGTISEKRKEEER